MSRKPDDILALHALAENGEIPPTAASAVDHLEAHLARRNGHPEKLHPTDSIVVTNIDVPDDRGEIPGRAITHIDEAEAAEATQQHARGTQILSEEAQRLEHRRPSKHRRPSDFGRDL
jgi:hypothetical protein